MNEKPHRIIRIIFWFFTIMSGMASFGLIVGPVASIPFALIFCDDPKVCNGSLSVVILKNLFFQLPSIILGLVGVLLVAISYYLYTRKKYVVGAFISSIFFVVTFMPDVQVKVTNFIGTVLSFLYRP